ncbi:hypothetical protein AX777_13895 [Sphingobium yanoikuyae]|uniref:Uncharacterized protein n=1 Tax=Sphingobium yanoikuyae TaxID=13690 RepID=A0A177JVV3_SPHYA|nr:hypothetical protein AYR46_14700 [Sphingobium yanoikuyae]OAH44455.1 hypothetical protein AX777_13895 [Sphingobium yanoikuyae]TKV43771.1 hypothetical protein A0U87_12110 [Sphingobium sp. MP9-4]
MLRSEEAQSIRRATAVYHQGQLRYDWQLRSKIHAMLDAKTRQIESRDMKYGEIFWFLCGSEIYRAPL